MRILGLLVLPWIMALTAQAQGPVNYADWRLEWAEEFNTPLDTAVLAQRWRFAYPWGRSSDNAIDDGYYTAEALRPGDGVLNMTIQRRAQARRYRGKALHYDAPMLMSRHLADSLRPQTCGPDEGFSYGLFEVRARQPQFGGIGPAFWLYGGVPDEIDIFETSANLLTNNFHLNPGGYWRPSRREDQISQSFFYSADPAGDLHQQFHTYSASWLPNEVTFYYDGIPIRRETRLVPPGCAMSLILNISVFNWARQSADTLAIDYIRVYRPRHLPAVPVVQRPSGSMPLSELAWVPAETAPGRPDQATHQGWQVAPVPRQPQRLALLLTDNYNPPPNLVLPLPVAGHWAPTWCQAGGMPELRVAFPAADSVRWTVRDQQGQALATGVTSGGSTWRPGWAALPPGTYALHLQQGPARAVQPLTIIARPAGSAPTAAWQLSPAPVPNAE